ncbi:hypothetical protein BGX20_010681 [Mortierella sp. AD010]|nr:hypothetical protein BGX20_010681 [Mortierella sp. AD010]
MITDLYPLDKPNQGKKFARFSEGLIEVIQELAITERQKRSQSRKPGNCFQILSNLASTYGAGAQVVVHRDFIMLPQEKLTKARKREQGYYAGIFEDMEKLREYLRSCFEVLYRCGSVIMRLDQSMRFVALCADCM